MTPVPSLKTVVTTTKLRKTTPMSTLLVLVIILVLIHLLLSSQELSFITTTSLLCSSHGNGGCAYDDSVKMTSGHVVKNSSTENTTTTTNNERISTDFNIDLMCNSVVGMTSSSSSSSSTRRRTSSFSSSTPSYVWVGNQWFPPTNIPLYTTPQMMRNLFQYENILWIGDSTSRQDHATMYSIMNATNLQDVTIQELNNDIGKPDKFPCPKGHPRFSLTKKCYDILITENDENDENDTNTRQKSNSSNSSNHAVLVDYAKDELQFFDQIPLFLNRSKLEIQRHQYTVLIFSMGLWDIWVGRCNNMTQLQHDLIEALDSIRNFLLQMQEQEQDQEQELTILWKTHGSSDSFEGHDIRRICSKMVHETTQTWFETNTIEQMIAGSGGDRSSSYMKLVNFGMEIQSRILGDQRIQGDHVRHFGPTGRTLAIQLVAHEMHKSICSREEERGKKKKKKNERGIGI